VRSPLKGSDEYTRWSHITREVLWEAPSVLQTRNHVHYFADYVVSPACPRDNFQPPSGIQTVGLKGYGLGKALVDFETMKTKDELYDVIGILASEILASLVDSR
jgi:hypothetical protein